MPDKIFKHTWLQLHSTRTIPYTIDDISVIVPSTKGRFEKRMEWFWDQYVAKTHPDVVERTYVPCDPGEDVPGIRIETEPRWIVYKTLAALEHITTRLTFRLANDILFIREGWEQLLVDQFNAQEKLQIIAEIQNGVSFPESQKALEKDWSFISKEYPKETTAAVYPHGARLFSQTAVWNAYYRHVLRYTAHDHDEIFWSQLARGDGIAFTKFGGINLYLDHVGVTNRDFADEYINGHIADRRKYLELHRGKVQFTVIE